MTKTSPRSQDSCARSSCLHALQVAVIAALVLGSTLGLHGQHRAQLSLDLLKHEARHRSAPARVIVHGSRAQIEEIAARHHLSVARFLDDSAVLFANSAEITGLAADAANDVLSGDVPVSPFMSVSNGSTAADQTRAGIPGFLLGIGAIPGVNGQGITIAVIDSGIARHPALSQRVIANVSLVSGDPDVDDEFGHGTHIAGIIAGNPSAAAGVTSLYTGGIAPGARLINVRVLGKDGTGWTSDVIAGIEWAISNRSRYNIRIINLSLGHPVTEPSATDPLDQAVLKATSAGIVVIASAGNAGKTADGTPILGGITSPGNSPFAITVGAINTKGTVARSDDVMATYSSRGPTRYDLAVKPDVVAPGNKIVSLEASGSYLASTYSFLHVTGQPSNAYMELSGTSMSAAMVSGGAALLMQADPNMSASQLKLALQTGATFMTDGGLMGGGAGSVNFWSSRKISSNGLLSVVNTLVGGLLTPASGAAFWDAGTLSTRIYAGTGIRLLSLLDGPLAWLDPNHYLHSGDLNLFGLGNPLASTGSNQLLWGDVASWTSNNQLLWGDTVYNPQGQQLLWGDSSSTDDNQLLWGDSATPSANSH
ncbi:MAG TPA: S8 family serine peptidase [Vicinamibacterales bacterium]|nr:S8 family serine peptidase [Vicinamibacterales bacterium]